MRARHVEKRVAEALGLGSTQFAVQAESLGPGDEVHGGKDEGDPVLVGQEVSERQVVQPEVLGRPDAVFNSGVATVAQLQFGFPPGQRW
jgi:hypothetical protein